MSLFITFEGLDGAGKSTQIERVKRRLEERGHRIICTREPGGTELGDVIRQILLDPARLGMSPHAEALLYASSRAQLIYEVVRPALENGHMVLCDRFVDASVAYQGAGLGLGAKAVSEMNAFATGGLKPDLTFLFDLPVETSQNRVQKSRAETPPDRIERRGADYFKRVREQFLTLAQDEPHRIVVVDATKDADSLEQEIWGQIEKRIG